MIRTLNFTGRKRIQREVARITLRANLNGTVGFDAEIDLDGWMFPPTAHVFIEAAFKTAFMRFDFGTVAAFTPPPDRTLNRLPQPQLAHFRIKVVEPASEGPGRLLAVADGITPEGLRGGERRRVPLFRVSYVGDLKDEIWRLDFDDAGPILELQQMPGMKEIARQEAFMALVYPELVRQILRQILCVEKIDDPQADPTSWQARWLKFGVLQADVRFPSLDAGIAGPEHEEWINAASSSFSRRLKFVAKFKKRYAGVEADSL